MCGIRPPIVIKHRAYTYIIDVLIVCLSITEPRGPTTAERGRRRKRSQRGSRRRTRARVGRIRIHGRRPTNSNWRCARKTRPGPVSYFPATGRRHNDHSRRFLPPYPLAQHPPVGPLLFYETDRGNPAAARSTYSSRSRLHAHLEILENISYSNSVHTASYRYRPTDVSRRECCAPAVTRR